MAKAMTMAQIEELTEEFAAARMEMMTHGEAFNSAMQAVRDEYAPMLRAFARVANTKAQRLYDAIDANRTLFENKGERSKVFDGIKVGLQKGKATITAADGQPINGDALFEALNEQGDDEVFANPETYVETISKPIMAALATLSDDQLAALDLKRTHGADSVLVKPVDGDAAKIVDALIKEFVAED